MKPSEFDFVRFDEWLGEREEKVRRWLAGKGDSNILLLEVAGSDYTTCRTPKESLECQLEAVNRQMDLAGDHIPFLEPWFGVGVFANAFGAEYVWTKGESPQTHYIIHDSETAANLEKPDIDAPVMNLVLEAIDYFINETHGKIPISCTDTQSPVDSATLLWETSGFFMSMYTEPEVVHHILDVITQLVVEFTHKQIKHLGESWSRPGHIMTSARGATGFSVSDDNIVMISPEHYKDFAVPYNEVLANEFGGLAVHSCGNYERQLRALLKTQKLIMIDGAFSLAVDPNPNTDLELFRDQLKGTDVMLHARMGEDWAEQLPRLYDPTIRLAVVVPAPQPGEPMDKNQTLLKSCLDI